MNEKNRRITKRSKPVASRARIDSQNVLALSRRRIMSLEGEGVAVSRNILDNKCTRKLKKVNDNEKSKLVLAHITKMHCYFKQCMKAKRLRI